MDGFAWGERLLMCEPTLGAQLLETVLLAIAFGVIMPTSTRFFASMFKRRPWYEHSSSIMRDIQERAMSMKMTDEMVHRAMGQMMPIMGQHMLGGLLCMPAIFGLGVPRDAAVALVRHGALIELAWELQDTAERLHERLFTELGHVTQPNGMFFFLFMHHAMQWALVIPMNLYYSHLSGYHELVFMLEGAAGFAGLVAFYSYTLDTSKRSDLRQIIICNAFGVVVMVYTRFIHYWWSGFKCLEHFYVEGSYVVLAVAMVCGCILMPYVAMSFIPQQWNKLVKFTRMYSRRSKVSHHRIYMTHTDRSTERCDFPTLLAGQRQQTDAQKGVSKMHAE